MDRIRSRTDACTGPRERVSVKKSGQRSDGGGLGTWWQTTPRFVLNMNKSVGRSRSRVGMKISSASSLVRSCATVCVSTGCAEISDSPQTAWGSGSGQLGVEGRVNLEYVYKTVVICHLHSWFLFSPFQDKPITPQMMPFPAGPLPFANFSFPRNFLLSNQF